jgi:L-aspartate oxidase
MKEYYETDVLIIGGGIAGSAAALTLSENGIKTTLISKGKDFTATNTNLAQGGIAALGEDENPRDFIDDIIKCGDGINYKNAVEQLVHNSEKLVKEILIKKIKVPFSMNHGDYDLAQEGAHTNRRILNVKDMTGKAIQESFYNYLKNRPNLKILFRHTAVDLLTFPHHSLNPARIYEEPKAIGAYILNQVTQKVMRVFAKKVILATGGISSIFLHSTNPEAAIGDGIAMAQRAGARMANLEYVQFHPTSLFHKEADSFLISEAVRGEGAKLKNIKGDYFMQKYSPLGELAPRDEVSRAIYAEMIKRGDDYVLLDLASFAKINIKERFPTISETCLKYGIDIEKRPIPVVPAAHYGIGGVLCDLNGRTSIKNLYAIGEVATTGVHGANRLASVSLLEGLVWGVKAAEDIAAKIDEEPPPYTIAEVPEWKYPHPQEKLDPALVWQDQVTIKYIMWNYSGIVRTTKRLERAKSDLAYLRHRIIKFYQSTEINNKIISLRDSVQTALLVVASALMNRVSKGAHYINDRPGNDAMRFLVGVNINKS